MMVPMLGVNGCRSLVGSRNGLEDCRNDGGYGREPAVIEEE